MARPFLFDKHGVAEGKKAIAFGHGLLVGLEDEFPPCEGGDHHQQSRAWKVEIRNYRIDHFKLIPGIDKHIRFTR
jgi:hypothetical protein